MLTVWVCQLGCYWIAVEVWTISSVTPSTYPWLTMENVLYIFEIFHLGGFWGGGG
jgi:hypothetical protein